MRFKLLKSLHLTATLLIIFSLFIFNSHYVPKVNALANSDFNASRIIDDSVFFNPNSMNTGEIQAFLNSKVPVCETNHTQDGYPYPPPYICLKDYTTVTASIPADSFCASVGAGSKSAATIIKEVSAACNINPQVLLILLQKEQALITDTWPLPSQYDKATGFACPDSDLGADVDANNNNCYDEFEGFFKQVYYGARQYQRYAKQPYLYNFRAGQAASILYNPNSSCGSSVVTIQNQATAGLYNYTPYQPNAAVLGSAHGQVVTCGAYGNINFWWQFWSWFGNPIGSPYAWLIDSFSYSGGDNSIAPGETETLTLKAKNVGRLPWYNHGDGPVKLATWEPANRSSSLFSSNRLTTLQENVVQPNEIGTFIFTVTPNTVGTFSESLNLVVEGYAWMQWPGFRPTITVPPAYQWQIQNVIYEKGTGYMDPGDLQLITVIAKNTGSATWNKLSGSPVRMGTWEPGRQSQTASSWLSSIRATDMNETTVAPGSNAGFQFWVRMPSTGQHYQRLNLVAEGQSWFNDPGLTLYLQGNDYSWSIDSVTYSSGTGYMTPGTTQTVTVRARNTGQATWRNSGVFPVKLGTWTPQRQSAVSASWSSPTRMSSLSEATVAPGQIGTFTATVSMPATGFYYERMNIVAEGSTWLNDTGLTLYLQGR